MQGTMICQLVDGDTGDLYYHKRNMETKTATSLRQQSHYNVTWVDVQNPTEDDFKKLEQDFQLHPVHLTESIQKIQHTQVEREDNYLFLVLHFPVASQPGGKLLIGQVGIFLGRDFMVTIRTADSAGLGALYAECDKEQDSSFFNQGSGFLAYNAIGSLISDVSQMTDEVIAELDEVEDLVFDNTNSDSERIGKLRQKIVRLRRMIGPKRQILKDLADQVDSFSGQEVARQFSNNTKSANKLWENIEEAKETIEIFKDADFTTSTEHTNQILAILTLLFTFTIPVTVGGTLYGMNVPLPGGIEAGPWTFLGEYTTFVLLAAGSGLVALVMYIYFKSKKWF